MSRRASLAFAIAVTWAIAIGVAIALSVAAAWPLALYFGGDPIATRRVAFIVAMIALGIWALRTSIVLTTEDRAQDDVFRASWPMAARGAELRARGMLDRRGQPAPAVLVAGDQLAELRGGERAQRGLVLERRVELLLVATGSDARARILDVELDALLEAVDDGRPRRIVLEPGTYHTVIERTDETDPRRSPVHAWWIGIETP